MLAAKSFTHGSSATVEGAQATKSFTSTAADVLTEGTSPPGRTTSSGGSGAGGREKGALT